MRKQATPLPMSHSSFCKGKEKKMAMLYRPLGRTGLNLSIISLGGSGYGKNYGPFDEKEANRALEYAKLIGLAFEVLK